MAEDLGTLAVHLTAESAELVTGMAKAVSAVASGSEEIISSVTEMGKIATGIFAAIGAAAVYEFAEFEEATLKLRDTIGQTDAVFNQMSNTIRGLSKDIPTGVDELAKIAGSAAQLGIQKSNIGEFTKTIAEFSEVTGVSASQAETDFVRIAKVAHVSQDEIGQLANTVTALGFSTGATQQQILDLTNQMAGTATQMRLTAPELLGLSASMASLGVEGGMAMNRLMIEINKGAQQGGEQLRILAQTAGVTEKQFTEAFAKDSIGAINMFLAGLKNMKTNGQDVIGTLDQIGLSGMRMAEPLLRAAESSDTLTKGIETANEAWKTNNTLSEDATRHSETFSAQIKITWNDLKDILITIGDGLVPTLKLFNQVLQDVLKSHVDWQGYMQTLVTNIVPAVITVIGLAGDAINGWRMIIANIKMAFNDMFSYAVSGLSWLMDAFEKVGALHIKLPGADYVRTLKDEFKKTADAAAADFENLASSPKFSTTLITSYDKFLTSAKAGNKEMADSFDSSYIASIQDVGVAVKKNILDPLILARNQAQHLLDNTDIPGFKTSTDKAGNKTSTFDPRSLNIPGISDPQVKQAQEVHAMLQNEELKYQKFLKDVHDGDVQLTGDYLAKKTAIVQAYNDRIKALQLAEYQTAFATSAKMFNDLASIAEAFGGKQSAAYEAMFAMSKAFAIADATVKIAQAIANAAADPPLPFPANIANMAAMASATATIVSSISAVSLNLQGKAKGGPVMGGTPYIVGEQGPELFVPSDNGSIVSNAALGKQGNTRIVVNNYTDATPTVKETKNGDEKVFEIMLKRVKGEVASEIRDGRGTVSKAMETTYNLYRGRNRDK